MERMTRLAGTGRPRGFRRGASLVESAFVIPILAMLVFSGFEFGAVLHMRQSMLHAARESARVLAVQGGSVAEAEQVALGLLPNPSLPYEFTFTTPAPNSVDRQVVAEISLPLGGDTVGMAIGAFDDDAELRVRVAMRSEQ
ncbi:MAG: hypothetical protein CMJ31_01170 [Phycisphaerae bacterium]|nr:hypothetical protein [Phycisphaerae bacterium]